jgi:hypothetical protein
MKHLFISAMMLIIVFTVHAQTRIAIKGGYNHSTARIHINDVSQPTGFIPGVNVGVQLKAGFEPPLHFTGLISYNMRGYSLSPLSGSIEKVETRFHNINVAPMLSYDIATGNHNHISLTTGPMAGFAFSGTQKTTEAGVTSSSKMIFSTASNFSPFDLAIYNSIGYHLDKVFIEASYHLGFVSINNNEEFDKTNIKNRGFGLSLGYYIK